MPVPADGGGLGDLDLVLSRYRVLAALLAREGETAKGRPLDNRNVVVGLVPKGAQKREAEQAIAAFFEDAAVRLGRQAIIDLCAAFERRALARVGNALGDAAKALAQSFGAGHFTAGGGKLLRETRSFESLESIFLLFADPATPEGRQLKVLRDVRNNIAHGKLTGMPSDITVEGTYALLGGLLRRMG